MATNDDDDETKKSVLQKSCTHINALMPIFGNALTAWIGQRNVKKPKYRTRTHSLARTHTHTTATLVNMSLRFQFCQKNPLCYLLLRGRWRLKHICEKRLMSSVKLKKKFYFKFYFEAIKKLHCVDQLQFQPNINGAGTLQNVSELFFYWF